MRILVTNDDGILSPGLTALAKALSKVGEVWVVAPDRERTAVAHAVTLHKPLQQAAWERVYAINGTPVDCNDLKLLSPPDLLVSGNNQGNGTTCCIRNGLGSDGRTIPMPSTRVAGGQEHLFRRWARYAVVSLA
jgi:5'/3'-nucleotidase SurE